MMGKSSVVNQYTLEIIALSLVDSVLLISSSKKKLIYILPGNFHFGVDVLLRAKKVGHQRHCLDF
jgi:hypothetical protein